MWGLRAWRRAKLGGLLTLWLQAIEKYILRMGNFLYGKLACAVQKYDGSWKHHVIFPDFVIVLLWRGSNPNPARDE